MRGRPLLLCLACVPPATQANRDMGVCDATDGASDSTRDETKVQPAAACSPFSDDAFYAAAPAGVPGTLLACERIPANNPTYRILYTTEGPLDTLATSSALARIPSGDSPKNGFPVVAWAHGTIGVADACAPSKYPDAPINSYVLPFVEAGYVMVATDYQGLGTPGPHPYLVGESEGRSLLNSISALMQVRDDSIDAATFGSHVFLAGHSQGGHAALFARELASEARLGEATTILGTIVYAPGLTTPRSLPLVLFNTTDTLWDGAAFFSLYLFEATLYRDGPALNTWLVQDIAKNLPFWAETRCYDDFADVLFAHANTVGDLFTESFVSAIASCSYPDLVCAKADPYWTYFLADEPGRNPGAGPVLIVQGMEDDLVVPIATGCLVERLTLRDGQPEVCTLKNTDHATVVDDSWTPVLAWMESLRKGEKVEGDLCDGVALPACGTDEP